MTSADLRRLASDPAAFRDGLTIPAALGRARFGECMADFQRRDFAALDAAFRALRDGALPSPGRFWIERTKGASKDTDLAVMLLWLLAFTSRPLTAQVGAADADQADELRKAAKGILRLNPWLSGRIEIQAWSILNSATDSRCEIIPADVAGSHGARPDLLILNELSHITKPEFAHNLMDNAAKMPRGVVCIATNAGFVPSWQFDLRETARESERWYFSAYDRPAAWIDPAELQERRRSTSESRFNRLWRGVWSADHGDALQPADIDSAVTCDGPLTKAEPGFVYAAGVDIGLRKDASALVIVGRHVGGGGHVETGEYRRGEWGEYIPVRTYKRQPATGRYRVARIETWKPSKGSRVSLEAIRFAILAAHRMFKLSAVAMDPHQGEHLAELLRNDRVPVQLVPQTGPTLNVQATTLIECFQQRTIDLFPHGDLVADIRALQLQEKSYGVRLVSPRTSNDGEGTAHGDTASALSIALPVLRDARQTSSIYGDGRQRLERWLNLNER